MDIVCGLFLTFVGLAGIVLTISLIVSFLIREPTNGVLDPATSDIIHGPGQAARQAINDLENAYVCEELQRAMDSDEQYAEMLRSVDEQLRRQA